MANHETILVVDDSALICKFVERAFEGEPVESIFAATAEEGLRLAFEKKPSLILLDIVLPKRTDGFAVCASLKADARTADIPILFIAAQGDEQDIVRGFQAGAIDYIPKPFTDVELRARVSFHLENQRMRKNLEQVNQVLQKALLDNQRLLETDSLTGVYNRRGFKRRIERLEAQKVPVCLILGDVDDFKDINDRYGHLAGDHALCALGTLLQNDGIDGSYVFRWGGEEFIIMLPTAGLEEARVSAEEIREKVESSIIEYEGNSIRCTLTMGVMEYDYKKTADENIRMLDKALYHGKHHGKNCCVTASEAQAQDAVV